MYRSILEAPRFHLCFNYLWKPKTLSHELQFKRGAEHDGAAAEGVVVGVGVDAVEDGVGVVALVQEVIEFESDAKLNIWQLVNAMLLAFVKEHRGDLKNIRFGW